MNRPSLLLVVALSSALTGCGYDLDVRLDDRLQGDTEIGALVRQDQDARNASDVGGWTSLFDDYFVYMPDGAPAISDRSHLAAWADSLFIKRRFELMVIAGDLEMGDGWAFAHNEIRGISISIASGDTVAVDTKELAVYRKTPKGWRIARLMVNRNDPDAGVPGSRIGDAAARDGSAGGPGR